MSSGDRGLSPAHWLARNAAELIPLGMYMEELDPAATDVEDKETYEMILAKQAADVYKRQIQGIGFSLSEVDCFYFAVIAEADRRKIPVFGICKGLQAMNVAFGGSPVSYTHLQLPMR